MQDRLSSLGAFVSTGKHLQFAIVSQRNARHADRPGREGARHEGHGIETLVCESA